MLYSSSRDDFKKTLGMGFFIGDYSSNDYEDVSYDALQASITRDRTDAPLTELEKVRGVMGVVDLPHKKAGFSWTHRPGHHHDSTTSSSSSSSSSSSTTTTVS